MTSVDDAVKGLARKATGFITNDECTAEAVDTRCSGGHDNIQLLNGRANARLKYLPRLVAVILRGQSMPRDAASSRTDGTNPSVDDRSSGSWTDSGGARAPVDPGQHRQCPGVQRQEHRISAES